MEQADLTVERLIAEIDALPRRSPTLAVDGGAAHASGRACIAAATLVALVERVAAS